MMAARQYLTAAIGHDPRYAKAITMLALTHYFDIRFSYTTELRRRSANSSNSPIELWHSIRTNPMRSG